MEHFCPKCNILMTKGYAYPALLATVLNPMSLFAKRNSKMHLFVCSGCGYTEWYVENPEKFK